jgi:type I restriction enzyme S subunit
MNDGTSFQQDDRASCNLPKGWTYLTLSDVSATSRNSIKRGPFGSMIKKEYFVPSGFKVYEQQNVIRDDFRQGNYYIDEIRFEQLKDFELKGGDVIISCSGTIGKATIAPEDIRRGIINQALLKITLDKSIVDAQYFVHLFGSESIQKKITSGIRGTAIRNMSSVRSLKTMLFPIPPLNEQRRIVGKIEELFTKLDAGVKSLETIKAQVKRYRLSVLKSTFEGRLTEEWRGTNKYEVGRSSEILESVRRNSRGIVTREGMTESDMPKPELPENWFWTTLEMCCDIVSGYAFRSRDFVTHGTPVVKIANIGYSEFVQQKQEYLPNTFRDKYPSFLVKPDAVLMALTRPVTNNTLKVCLYPPDAKLGLLNQRVAMMTPFDHIEREYLFLYMQSTFFKSQILNGMSETLQPNLSPTKLRSFYVPLCSPLEQRRIVAKVEELFTKLDAGVKSLDMVRRQSEKLRQSTLKHAFEGKLVPQDPEDEPAGVLLERTRLLKSQSSDLIKSDQKSKKRRKQSDSRQRRLA